MARQQSGNWSFDDDPPSHSERLTMAWLEWSLDTLAKLGCCPTPSSRFPESLSYIKRVHNHPDLLERTEVRAQVTEIQRSAWELLLIVIATVQSDRTTSPFTRAKLLEMFAGALPADDSHARNIQYELYVSALFVIGEFRVRRGPPDAQVQVR